MQYSKVEPLAQYSPWLDDRVFLDVYAVCSSRKRTKVDIMRCYELWQLVEEVKDLRGGLIEVGVWAGGSGVLIAKRANMLGITDTTYLADTFEGVVKAGGKDSLYINGEHKIGSDSVKGLMAEVGVSNTHILEGIFPDDTSKLIKDKEFRFCHIDCDVYQSSKDVLKWVWPKLVVGGVVVFDDYGFDGTDGVTTLVNENRGLVDRLVVHNLNGHALIIKICNTKI